VGIEGMNNLKRLGLFESANVESRARRGKSWRRVPEVLCVTEVIQGVPGGMEKTSGECSIC